MSRSARTASLICATTVLSAAAISFLLWQRAADPMFTIQRMGRFIDARVTIFDDAAPRIVRSGEFRVAAGQLARRLKEARTPEHLHEFALAELAGGRPRVARDLLAEASRLQPDDLEILIDLAAAELAMGNVAEAAEISGRVLRHDPGNEEATFNWALALERLGLRPVAVDAWEKYLMLDAQSGWADVARQHLAGLRHPRPTYDEQSRLLMRGADAETVERVVRRFPQRARGRAQNYILPQWIETGHPADLDLLRKIATARARLGDPYLLDIVEHAVTNRSNVAAGLREFTSARSAEEKLQWDVAGDRFSRAAVLLERAGSPLAIGASIYAAQGDYSQGNSDAALARLHAVEKRLLNSRNKYPAMAAESAWVRALVMGRLGQPQQSLEAYRYALAEATRGGEIEHAAALAAMVAWMLETAGDPAEADKYRLETLRRNETIDAAPERMYTSYLDAAWIALRGGRPHLALAFVDGLTRIAHRDGHPLHLAESDAWRALGLLELGDRTGARDAVAAARAHAMRIPVKATRDFTLANIEYTAGRLEISARPAEAVHHFTSALDLWQRHYWRFHMASALLARGEAAVLMNDLTAAERDFRAGVAEMEKQRSTLEEPPVRVAYFERSHGLFDRLTKLLLDQRRAAEALSVVERKRARLLLDQIAARGGATAAPMESGIIAGTVNKTTAIVVVALLDDSAELWLVRDGQITHARGTARRSDIDAAVARHLNAIASGDTRVMRNTGMWLYDQLLAPVLAASGHKGDLVIIPDGSLQSFPFGTLVTGTGAYLVEAHTIAVAPSASVFLSVHATLGKRVLVVAQPKPAGFDFLPNTKREAVDIAAQYGATPQIGSKITPMDFIAAAGDAALVHFAGHATADVDQPATSSLVFETSEGRAYRLTAEQIGQSTLPHHPLVVLAACSTARGKLRRTEGIDSLAYAFLQAGARGVVATLWDIEDVDSSRLFRTFHAHLHKGARPADALRDAQLALLYSSNPRDRSPAVWGSVTLIGTL